MNTRNKWLVMQSDERTTYILYDKISAFTYSESTKRIVVYVDGAAMPFEFNFTNFTALKAAYDDMLENLRPY